jgi:hypothetical protein
MSLKLNSSGGGSVTLQEPTTASNVTLNLPAADGTVVYENASGNVGIGTSSPSFKLDVTGNARVGNVYGTGLTVVVSGNSITYPTDNTLAFNTNGSERARIDSNGNLCVGQTSSDGKVSVTTSSSSVAYTSRGASGDVGTAHISLNKFDNNSTTSQRFVQFTINSGNNGSGQINANGAAQAAFGSFSDRRLKENIVDLPTQINNIMALRPVEFDYIESEGGGHQTGFIAQEMQEVYPDAVGERAPDGMLTVTGWSKTEARLVKAIQELKAEVDSLRAQVEAQ